MHASPSDTVLQLKISLNHSHPPIWRRIQIPSSATFLDLHAAIQDSFGWEDYHLHHFIFGERTYEPVYIGPRHEDNFIDYLTEKETRLSEWLTHVGGNCLYEYDFGDSWEHVVLLEKVLPLEPLAKYPCCIAGRRACPPEDSGGIPGFEYKLDILKHPRSKYYGEIRDWMGGFDPEHFTPSEIVFKPIDGHDAEKREE